MDLFEVSAKFKINGRAVSITPYGEGHINETYLLVTDKGFKYILQKINHRLFKDVEKLMRNIELVTAHVAEKVRQKGGDVSREVLTIVRTDEDKTYYGDDETGYFRVYIYIYNATAHQVVKKSEHFYQSAYAFGTFQNQLADFDARRLHEIIPNFHNTVVRFENFKRAVEADRMGRLRLVRREVDFVLEREGYCGRIVKLLECGQMPLKVTHNDTKLNNVMIDDATDKAVAVIDLDTVMPGSSCYDFGDSIRFGCNPAAEDEVDLSKVNFRLDLFKAYTEGYLAALKNISETEKEYLPFSAILMTYECGMRFLTDYLEGDTYFRIKRQNHNLDRARTQFKLVSDMEKALGQMNEIVYSFK
ncbi:MAG: aminoglycoside phosphotransferase family protein [Clostridiales bacterium]|nr:aminoglycoside phosphotransferase family protein [Clostridiales bacterium]